MLFSKKFYLDFTLGSAFYFFILASAGEWEIHVGKAVHNYLVFDLKI